MSKSSTTPKADLSQSAAGEDTGKDGPIVFSSHLVSTRGPGLSEFESALNTAYNAYNRWRVRCVAVIGVRDLTFLDVLVVYHVNHREWAKRLADTYFVLNVEDTHLVTYPLEKLQGTELVEGAHNGKGVTYTTTEVDGKACARYREIRGQCLTSNISPSGEENAETGELACLLRVLMGLYKRAARSATLL